MRNGLKEQRKGGRRIRDWKGARRVKKPRKWSWRLRSENRMCVQEEKGEGKKRIKWNEESRLEIMNERAYQGK